MNATNALILCLFSIVLSVVGAINWKADSDYREGMRELRAPIRCVDAPTIFAKAKP